VDSNHSGRLVHHQQGLGYQQRDDGGQWTSVSSQLEFGTNDASATANIPEENVLLDINWRGGSKRKRP
jgi:hypothetical protein